MKSSEELSERFKRVLTVMMSCTLGGFYGKNKMRDRKELLILYRLSTLLYSVPNSVDFAGNMTPWGKVCGFSH